MKHGMRIATTALLFGLAGAAGAAEGRPDVVFFVVDDLGRADVGFMGGSQIRTPQIDRLAKAGAVLTQFYVQPVCSPTRASLLTGRYPMRYGLQVGVVRPDATYGLPLEERMLPKAMKEAGYTTAICGKWHVGSFDKAYWPNARGFDHAYGHLFGMIDYFTHVRDGKPDWYRNGEPLKEEGYSTTLIADEAVRVVERQPKDKPLFLYVPFNGVHSPWQVPEAYAKPYASLGNPRGTYAGMLAAVDEAIGRIAGAVEKAGRRPNTLFVFSSDNGGPGPRKITDNGPLRAGKGTVYEGGVRVCGFATWDGRIPAGTTRDGLMHMVDWYPTLLKLAGAPLDQPLPLDGVDAWPMVAEGRPSARSEVLCNTTPNGGALRMGDWKIVVSSGRRAATPAKAGGKKAGARAAAAEADPAVELYNLRDDLGETKDLAASNPEKRKELLARYEQLAREAAAPKNRE